MFGFLSPATSGRITPMTFNGSAPNNSAIGHRVDGELQPHAAIDLLSEVLRGEAPCPTCSRRSEGASRPSRCGRSGRANGR